MPGMRGLVCWVRAGAESVIGTSVVNYYLSERSSLCEVDEWVTSGSFSEKSSLCGSFEYLSCFLQCCTQSRTLSKIEKPIVLSLSLIRSDVGWR